MDWTTIAGLAARHMLTGAGTWLIAHGLLDAGAQDNFVGGGMILVGVLWSVIQKWRAGWRPSATVARLLPLLAVLPLLGACSLEAILQRADVVIGRVNAGIARADEVAKELCQTPDGGPGLLVRLNASATTMACAAQASGKTQKRIAQLAEYGGQFCANPTATSLGKLMVYVAEGLRAARDATAAGCPAQ